MGFINGNDEVGKAKVFKTALESKLYAENKKLKEDQDKLIDVVRFYAYDIESECEYHNEYDFYYCGDRTGDKAAAVLREIKK